MKVSNAVPDLVLVDRVTGVEIVSAPLPLFVFALVLLVLLAVQIARIGRR